MARIKAGAEDSGYRLPGAYRNVLWEQCYRRPDPRLIHDVDSGQRQQIEEAARRAAEELFAERLASGEPLSVPRWRLGGHTVPVPMDVPMFRDRSITGWTVLADDTVVPARHRTREEACG